MLYTNWYNPLYLLINEVVSMKLQIKGPQPNIMEV